MSGPSGIDAGRSTVWSIADALEADRTAGDPRLESGGCSRRRMVAAVRLFQASPNAKTRTSDSRTEICRVFTPSMPRRGPDAVPVVKKCVSRLFESQQRFGCGGIQLVRTTSMDRLRRAARRQKLNARPR